MLPRIKTFEALDDFFLKIEFDDGKKILYEYGKILFYLSARNGIM